MSRTLGAKDPQEAPAKAAEHAFGEKIRVLTKGKAQPVRPGQHGLAHKVDDKAQQQTHRLPRTVGYRIDPETGARLQPERPDSLTGAHLPPGLGQPELPGIKQILCHRIRPPLE